MQQDEQSVEIMRFVYVGLIAVTGGLLTGYWLASLCLALFIYILWMNHKLKQLNQWLQTKNAVDMPDSDGIWASLTSQIHYLQKHTDKRKRRMKKLLKRFQGIITGLPYATIILNGKNEIDWANEHAAELLNINIKSDRGQNIANLLRLNNVHKILEKNSNKEIEINSPRDNNRQLALQLIPVQSDLKLIIARDISERVQIQKMRKAFIANASHELRTPLTVISGYLEILQSDSNLSDSSKMAVNTAAEQALRMQRIIEDLLTLSRLENSELKGKSNYELAMPKILRSICANEIELLSEHSHHTLITDIDDDLTIRGAESEVISVCTNLIYNAIRHTAKGTAIKVNWKKSNKGEACLSVQDNGAGIPAEHLAHITERFYRVDKGRSRDTGGTGLGLAIVQHIIQRHNGRLEIDSMVGRGSTFRVYFPEDRVV